MSLEEQTKPKMRRSMRILLIVSLTLNFLVRNFPLSGAVAHWRSPDGHRGRDHGFNSPYTRALEMKDRRAVGEAIRNHYRNRSSERPSRERGTAQAREAVALLRVSPLDVGALEDLLNRQVGRSQSRQKIAQAIWLEHMKTLSDADRAAYADRLEVILNEPRRGGRMQDD